MESVAYDLKENGYATHAIHNHRAAFYSRNEVYPNLGFDDFTALEYMPAVEKTPTNWAKDGVLKDQILQALDVTEDQAEPGVHGLCAGPRQIPHGAGAGGPGRHGGSVP